MQSTPFSKLNMIPQKLNNLYKPFSRYIASKVTYSQPNIEYLSSYLHLRKFWQCRNSTFGTIRRDLHKPIRLKLNIYIFWPSKFWRHPKQLAKNPQKCAINSFLKAEYDPTKIGPFIYEPFSHNKSGGLWLSMTVLLVGMGNLHLAVFECGCAHCGYNLPNKLYKVISRIKPSIKILSWTILSFM